MIVTTFDSSRIDALRRRAQTACALKNEAPAGWSKSAIDPTRLLAVFEALRLKEGFARRAYQFRDGGNGNGVVWAMPASSPFPDPEDCTRFEDGFLESPRPPDALDDVMQVIDGDGTPWSYLCASLFQRETLEFGAMWHGSDWGTHRILDRNPFTSTARGRRRGEDWPSGRAGAWRWQLADPDEWRPHVTQDDAGVTVTLVTFSGLGGEAICRHTDRFRMGSYCFDSDREVLATGPSGYVF